MQNIRIQKDFGVDEIESLYRHLEKWSEFDTVVNIVVPTKIDSHFIGLVPLLLQFIVSWVRYPYSGKLLLDIKDPKNENWEEIFEAEHIYPIVALTINKNGVFDATGDIPLNDFIRLAFQAVRQKIIKAKAWKGYKIMLTGIDHFPVQHGLLTSFETSNGFIQNQAVISSNLKPAFDAILSYSDLTRDVFSPYQNDFVNIIHELVKNTWEWGREDKDKVPLDPSIRGLLMRFHRRKRITYAKEALGHRGLREYFESEVLKENVLQEIYIIEISVYDSGIGFIERFQGDRLKTDDDITIIKKCLIKHQTSSQSLERSEKGMGLDKILQILSLKGFIHIKTNRSWVYRNLITHPYKPTTIDQDIELFDWKNDSHDDFTQYPNAQGSVVTILFPIAINPPQ